jgi:hypothetical protein
VGLRCLSYGAAWVPCGLVVAGRVEGEIAQELAGGGVDDADVQVLDVNRPGKSGDSFLD